MEVGACRGARRQSREGRDTSIKKRAIKIKKTNTRGKAKSTTEGTDDAHSDDSASGGRWRSSGRTAAIASSTFTSSLHGAHTAGTALASVALVLTPCFAGFPSRRTRSELRPRAKAQKEQRTKRG